jgi:DNA-binding XRE family transcriptional regulator/DNA-directed RNA polymerase subunit RPC12/RpoP
MINISKQKLKNLYQKRKLSTPQIAKILKVSDTTINVKLRKYNIKIRTASQAMEILFKNPENHPSYLDGRTLKNYYCKDCDKKICRHTGIKKGRCLSCSHKKLWKNKIYKEKHNKALHKHHIDGNKNNNHNKNLLKLSSKEHRKVHNSLLKLTYLLIQKNIIIFNKKRKVYNLKKGII